MGTQCHYMQKVNKDGDAEGPIERVNLNDWARKRKSGYVFRTEAEFREQVAATPDQAEDVDAVPTMENTKAEITEYLEANGFEVDPNDTKAELLEALAG